MGPGLHALPVFSVLCRFPSCDSGSLKWSFRTGTDDNRKSNQSCHQGLTGWPQQCLSIMRQHGPSGREKKKKKRKMKLPDREVGNKNTRAEKIESRKIKSWQDTQTGGAGWKIGRCTTGCWNRVRKTEKEKSGTAAQTIVKKQRNNKRRVTKGIEDIKQRAVRNMKSWVAQKKKKNVRLNFSLKRGEK